MIVFNREDLENTANGANFLASGGGGSKDVTYTVLKEILELSDTVTVTEVGDVKPEEWGSMMASIGSIKAEAEVGLRGGSRRALRLLEKEVAKNFSFIMPVETGCNMFSALLASLKMKKACLDGDGAGRAVPTLTMLTFSSKPIGPCALANEQNEDMGETDTKVTLYAQTPGEVEALARPLVALEHQFDEIAGIACWSMTGKDMKTCIVEGSITRARDVGRALATVGKDTANPIEALKLVYGDNVYPIIHGKVTEKSLTTSGSFDMGTTVFTSIDEKQKVSIANQNENLIAWDSLRNTPLVMAPDLICNVLPDGTGLSNYDLNVGQEVYVIGLKANPMLREEIYLPAFLNGLQGVGYYGCYVPVEDLFG